MAEIEHPPTETSEDRAPDVVEAERLIGLTLALGIVAALIALAVLSWLAEEMLTGQTASFDRAVSSAVHAIATPALTEVMWFASRFGGPSRLSIIAVIIFAVFAYKKWFRGVVLLLVTLGGAGLLDTLLKLSFRRERPNPLFDYPLPGSYSFPSGHALFSFVFFGSAAVLLAHRVRGHAPRVLIFAIAAALIGVIGISRIYLNVHHPSDVLAGYLVALVWVVAVAFGDRLASRGVFRRSNWRKLVRV